MRDLAKHLPDDKRTVEQVRRMREILHGVCSPAEVDRNAKEAQKKLKAEMAAAGELEQEVYNRGCERNVEKLIPWEWKEFEDLARKNKR